MTDTVFAAIIGVGGTALGALIAYNFSKSLIGRTHRDALKILELTEFNRAGAAFRVAFVDVIYLLRQNTEDGKEFIDRIVTPEALLAQEKAKILFEPFLDKITLTSFNKAWEDYTECRYTEGKYNYNYSEDRTSDEDRKARSQYCLAHIDNLLSYAKLKY